MSVSEIVRQVAESYSGFNADERYEFAALVAPLDVEDISSEWLTELHSRADDIDSGHVQLVEGEEVMRRLRAV
jgi:Putative addiction module component